MRSSFESGDGSRMLTGVKLCILLSVLLLAAAGCKNDQVGSTVAVSGPKAAPEDEARTVAENGVAQIPRAAEGRPQPRLSTMKLWVGTNELTAELAITMPQIMTGMMWRTNMAEMDAMLFIFDRPHRAQFWMRNTPLPLSCAYIDPEGTILELHDMKPRDESPIPANSDQVQYVLEVNQGWFERHNVAPGMLVTTERGSLGKTFWRR